MYPWINKKRLKTLSVEGKDGILIFKTDSELARVYLKDNDIEKVVFSGDNQEETLIQKADRFHLVVGESNWRRDVFHYLKPGGPAPTMRLGITRHSGLGTWSSLPHNFELNTEPGFEEVFFYILEGEPNKGIQVGKGVWSDEVWPIENQSFGTVPMGYHPVVGEPGVRVSYVWVYLAKKKSWEKI